MKQMEQSFAPAISGDSVDLSELGGEGLTEHGAMADRFAITNVRFRQEPVPTASAEIGGFPLFFEFPAGTELRECVDAFVVAALIPAMAVGLPLHVPGEWPVSPRLLGSMRTLQSILKSWSHGLECIPVEAHSAPVPRMAGDGVASFFSGGVDSSYTFLKHSETITDAILIQGMADTSLDNPHFPAIEAKLRVAAEHFGKRLVVVRTNAREFLDWAGVTMALYHGALLASVALLLGSRCALLPSSERFDRLAPWGSHPLLDGHWSTEYCEIVHDGCELDRAGKLAKVMESPALLRVLRVCNGNAAFNCGRCEKCLRTMTALEVLGGKTEALPPLELGALRRLGLANDGDAESARENLNLALAMGRKDIAAALDKILRRWAIKDALRKLDRALLNGAVFQASLWLRRVPPPRKAAGLTKFEKY